MTRYETQLALLDRLGPTLLLELRVEGRPPRAKHHPQVVARGPRMQVGGHKWVRLDLVSPGTRPDPTWEAWRSDVVPELRAMGLATIDQPVIAGVCAVFPRPQSPRKTYRLRGVDRPYPAPWTSDRVPFVGRPDHDQVVKAGVDVLVQGGLLVDDPLVVGYVGGISRWYAAVGEEPHVHLTLWSC